MGHQAITKLVVSSDQVLISRAPQCMTWSNDEAMPGVLSDKLSHSIGQLALDWRGSSPGIAGSTAQKTLDRHSLRAWTHSKEHWIDDPNKKLWISPICFGGGKDELSTGHACIPSSDWTTHRPKRRYGFQKFNTKQNLKLLSVPARSVWPQAKHIGFSTRNQRTCNASSLWEDARRCLIFRGDIHPQPKKQYKWIKILEVA